MKKYYVAYGSNLNINQMFFRCPDAEVVGVSWIEDYELLYKGSKTGAYLTIEEKKGSKVPVGIWAVSEKDEKALDRYEGYPVFYYKKTLTLPVEDILSEEITDRECFVYIMHEDRKIGIPSNRYVDTVSEGYESFGFDTKYLTAAAEKAERMVEHERTHNFHWL